MLKMDQVADESGQQAAITLTLQSHNSEANNQFRRIIFAENKLYWGIDALTIAFSSPTSWQDET